ncbi:MAG: aldose 1-epimerase family protein [Faecalicatena sp.]|uniref:aldose 1-epimerase family protein n=1 Tax=Faecalicatena sp. TaxID=2005360 RepID=UPI00258C4F6B|nr:aldose 1-epimerase family protein [Faecalicatena sp.]MCI6467239.1 aldose 1-epimerase family protein [Faecalicatena sp.]MDY5620244.1 aldose 1-epimerase family protein [Lachnospiraceae bacterium]
MEYTLKNDVLKVSFQSKGAALSSIQDKDGTEFLWQGDKTYWSGQAPVLFPICGSLRDDKAQIGDGKVTEMPRHGIVRKREFICEKQGENEIVFSLKSDEEMLKQYPYPFVLKIKYTLTGNTIRTQYEVNNTGEEDMPFFIGGHPGFNCPLFDTEHYDDYRVEFLQEEHCSVPTPVTETGLIDMEHRSPFLQNQKEVSLSHEMFEKDAVILDEIKSRSVKLLSKNHKKGVRLDFEDFPYLILWSTANHGPFIAMEPWVGLSTCSDESDVFEEKRNIQTAKSGECREYYFDITILGE